MPDFNSANTNAALDFMNGFNFEFDQLMGTSSFLELGSNYSAHYPLSTGSSTFEHTSDPNLLPRDFDTVMPCAVPAQDPLQDFMSLWRTYGSFDDSDATANFGAFVQTFVEPSLNDSGKRRDGGPCA
ncbi:hypothetical protein B0H14DRAFT_3506157 [Mycena olivaceomarginata]|nr:hypothetical protein B0H14DRAFT_3506157 [Mycena olivaceomarginata]